MVCQFFLINVVVFHAFCELFVISRTLGSSMEVQIRFEKDNINCLFLVFFEVDDAFCHDVQVDKILI